jgi:predicted secreted protein
MPGGRQYQTLRFKVIGVGNSNLTLYRHRPSNEGAHAGDNFNISLLSVPGGSWGSGSTTTLTESDTGGGFTLRTGDTLIVRLRSNPTTGYSWNLAGGAPATLQLIGQPAFERPTNGLIGASGVQVYKFKVVGQGSNVLRFLYQRPFAPGGIEAARKWEAFLTTVSR